MVTCNESDLILYKFAVRDVRFLVVTSVGPNLHIFYTCVLFTLRSHAVHFFLCVLVDCSSKMFYLFFSSMLFPVYIF